MKSLYILFFFISEIVDKVVYIKDNKINFVFLFRVYLFVLIKWWNLKIDRIFFENEWLELFVRLF